MWALFKDYISLISVLNFRRLTNVVFVYFSYHYSRFTDKAIIPPHPISITIEPTNNCNLKCCQCSTGNRSSTRNRGVIKLELFERVLMEVSRKSWYLNLYFQGEPLLVPSFSEMVRMAKNQKFYVSTSTNGHYLDDTTCKQIIDSHLDRLVISMDGVSQETYEAYREGGQLSRVQEGIDKLVRLRKEKGGSKPFIELQFLVFKHNQHEISAVKDFAKRSGVDKLSLKSAQLIDMQHDADLLTDYEKYSRYIKLSDRTLAIKSRLSNHCFRMWSSVVVTWDGIVVPCCFDKDADYQLGDLNKEPFHDVWKGPEYAEFRLKIHEGRRNIPMCCNCTEGLMI